MGIFMRPIADNKNNILIPVFILQAEEVVKNMVCWNVLFHCLFCHS